MLNPQLCRLLVLLVLGIGAASVATTLAAQERRATPPESIRTRDGFRVELLRSAQADESSWISMTFDPQGRIILGLDDRGLARLAIDSDGPGTTFARIPETESLRHIRGVLYAHSALYISATDSQGLYRMRDLGDTFSAPELLQELPYHSRYGHGTNQITLGPDKMIYFVIGNDVVMPASKSENSPYRNPQNDWLLPYRHDAGHDDRVGYIVKVDPEGESWEVVAGGFRNQVDVAFSADGEMFTWDADMEWDVGLPWYRPTRLNHVVAGGEYGWRWGSGKWPAWFPDSLPTTLDTGLGSPTGLVFGDSSSWPERFRQALYMADWQFGRILIVDLQPQGASYQASAQWFLEGGPLNVCDLTFGPDGAMYFITGGRGSQSGLYRVTWTGAEGAAADAHAPAAAPAPLAVHATADTAAEAAQAKAARALRQRLESYQRQVDPAAVDVLWPQLASDDPWVRFAARVALEKQPLAAWRQRIVEGEPSSLGFQTALLALARVGQGDDAVLLIERWLQIPWSQAEPAQWLLPLRTLQLSLIRHGLPSAALQQRLRERLEPLFPQDHFPANWLLQELLVKLRSPSIVAQSIGLIESAPTQEEQVQYAKTLSHVDWGWDRDAAQRVVTWLDHRRDMTGGHLVSKAWQNLRGDFTELWDDSIRASLAESLALLDQPRPQEVIPAETPRPLVRRWTIDDLADDISALQPEAHSREVAKRCSSPPHVSNAIVSASGERPSVPT